MGVKVNDEFITSSEGAARGGELEDYAREELGVAANLRVATPSTQQSHVSQSIHL